jgi:hypothetical protein
VYLSRPPPIPAKNSTLTGRAICTDDVLLRALSRVALPMLAIFPSVVLLVEDRTGLLNYLAMHQTYELLRVRFCGTMDWVLLVCATERS